MNRLLRKPVVWLPVSTVLLVFLVWRSHAVEAASSLTLVDPGPLIVAIALNLVIMLLWAARSADLLGAAGYPVGVIPLIPMTSFANTLNNLTPGSMGELVRLYLLRAHHAVDYATGGAVVLIERVVAIGYLAGSALVLWLGHVLGIPPLLQLIVLVALVALPALAYGLGIRPSALLAALPAGRFVGAGRWQGASAALRRLDSTVARLLTDPVRAGLFALLTGTVFATYTIQLMLVAVALGHPLDPVVAWSALGLGITAGVVSLLPFGLGSTDLVVVGVLTASGVGSIEATAIALTYRLVSTLPLGLAGVASYGFLSASLPASGTGGAMTAATQGLADIGGSP